VVLEAGADYLLTCKLNQPTLWRGFASDLIIDGIARLILIVRLLG
jgi:hypothetical protein